MDELIEFITAEVVRRWQQSAQGVIGPILADAIRARYPGLSYSALGVERLADVIRITEERGHLIRNRGVKHLEVFPKGVDPLTSVSCSPLQRASRTERLVPPQIWQALLFFHPGEARFFDRANGNVVRVIEALAEPYAGNPRYVPLQTIPADIQKAWMREFVAIHSGAVVVADAIESDLWYTAFWNRLRAADTDLALAWTSARARHVIEYVKQWAGQHGVTVNEVFSPRPLAARGPATGDVAEVCRPTVQQGREDESLRAAVLGTLSDMSLDELLTLSLPLRHLVRHFKPR